MSGFQAPITISQAIDRIQRNEFLLPAFQREFVWSSGQIEKLFDSLMKGYPISSMLFWKVKGETKADFRFYQFLRRYVQHHHSHNEPFATNGANDFHAVLDGQQRLTALHIGLCGSYAYKEYRRQYVYSESNYPTRHLYLNLSSQYSEEESDMTYKFSFIDKEETKERDLYVNSDSETWFKVGRIMGLRKDDTLDDFLEENDFDKSIKKILRRLDKVVHNENFINFYEEDEQAPDKAVNIFVRINSGGTHLSFSDILMSIAVANWEKLDARTEIHSLVDAIRQKGFNINQDFVLKSFLFLFHKDVRFRITSFKSDFILQVEQDWSKIRNAIISLFDLLKSFGLTDYTLTTYNAVLPVLYYMYHKGVYADFTTKVSFKEDRHVIRKWLYTILLRRTFGGQTDAVLTQARRAFTDEIGESYFKIDIPEKFPSAKLNEKIKKITDIGDDYINELLNTQKDSRYSFPILALLFPDMDYENRNFHLDHMHPAASFSTLPKEFGVEWSSYNSILNLQMLDANENSSKNAGPLDQWIENQVADNERKRFFEQRYIPKDVSLELVSFPEFIAARKEILIDKLRLILN